MKVNINKKLVGSKEEVDNLIKEHSNEPYVAVAFDKENLPVIETNQHFIPIEVTNEVLRQVCTEYKKQITDSLYKDLPDKHKEYTSHIYRKLQAQKKWSFFWYTCFMIALLIILLS
jgi:hypothetical protein